MAKTKKEIEREKEEERFLKRYKFFNLYLALSALQK